MFNETMQSKRAIAATVVGAVFLLIGILGFVNDPVLGIFDVDLVHNIVHVASGLFLVIYGSKNFFTAKRASLIVGVTYALVTVLGFLMIRDHGHLLGIMEINFADNFLHLFLTLVLLGLGLL